VKASIYTGKVWHQRHAPKKNAFRYRLFLVMLELDELEEIFRGNLFWGMQFPAVARFRREDHFGDPTVTLAETVRDTVAQANGVRPHGPIRLLTHLRYFGFYTNPISLYYCYGKDDERVEHVVAEVHNTPWNERHVYVWPGEVCRNPESEYRCAKAFHVSPFMEMDHAYRCQLNEPGEALAVHLSNERDGEVLFEAGMSLCRRPWNATTRAQSLLSFPLITLRVLLAIYWQALRLFLKGVPFRPHPKRETQLKERHNP
jgi:uncharacterized protein